MKQLKTFLVAALLGTVAVNSTAQTIIASGFCGAQDTNLYWTLDSDSLLSINGSGDMYGCQKYTDSRIKTVIIGDSVTSIEDYIFYYCPNLVSVIIGNSVTSIGNHAFWMCSRLVSVTMGNNVKIIGDETFAACRRLASITMSENLTSIGYRAFAQCYALTLVAIPDSVISIGNEVFHYCDNLASITIGNSITSIGAEAFYACDDLASLIVRAETPPALGINVFDGVPKTISVYVPCGSVPAYQNDADWSYFRNFKEELANATCYSDTISQGEAYNNGNFTNLTQAGIYYDTLQNIHGCDSIIELTLVVTSVGIVETGRAPSLQIYPNPTTGQLTIDNEQLTIETIEIYNIAGQLLLSQKSHLSLQTIDITHLKSGIYFIKINNITQKLIKL